MRTSMQSDQDQRIPTLLIQVADIPRTHPAHHLYPSGQHLQINIVQRLDENVAGPRCPGTSYNR